MSSVYSHRQLVFLGLIDPSAAANLETEVADLLGGRFVISRLFLQVVESWATGADVIEVNWRPSPASATGEVDLGQFTVPVTAAANDQLSAVLLDIPPPVGVATANAQGIGGELVHLGAAFPFMGPGGSINLEGTTVASSAGQANVWAEVLIDGYSDGDQTVVELAVT